MQEFCAGRSHLAVEQVHRDRYVQMNQEGNGYKHQDKNNRGERVSITLHDVPPGRAAITNRRY